MKISNKLASLRENQRHAANKAQILLGAACCLCISMPALAQDNDQGLTLSAGATGSYSDNYLRLSDIAVAERPTLIPQEYSLVTNAQLGWTQRVGRQHLYLNVDAGYRVNKNNSYLDSESIRSDAGLNWKLGAKCSGSITAGYSRRQSDFETVDDAVPNIMNQKTAGSRNNCLFTPRIGLSFGGSILGDNNSAASRAINDLESQQAWAGIQLDLSRGDYVSLLARYTWRQYDNRLVSAGSSDKNKQLDLGLEFQKSFGPRITFIGWGGYSELKNKLLPQIDFNGFSGKADLSYDVGGRHMVSIGARREIDSSANLTASYIQVEGIHASVSSKWGPKMHSEFSVSQNEREIAILPSDISGSIIQNDSDKVKMARASFAYDIGRLITLRLSGRYADRNARLERFNYTEKAVIFSIQFKYR